MAENPSPDFFNEVGSWVVNSAQDQVSIPKSLSEQVRAHNCRSSKLGEFTNAAGLFHRNLIERLATPLRSTQPSHGATKCHIVK